MRNLFVVALCVCTCKSSDKPKTPEAARAESKGVAIKFEPVVKSVEAEYFEKDDVAADKAKIKVQVKNGDVDVNGKVRIAIMKAGADREESKAIREEWAGADMPMAPGTYDVLIKYDESHVAKAHGWLRGVVLKPKNLLRARVAIDYPVGKVRYNVTNNGQSVDGKTRIAVYKPGADAQESKALMEEWAGAEMRLPAGKYDVFVKYHESDQAYENKWLRGVDVAGGHQLKKETIVLETAVGFVRVVAMNKDENVNGKSRYAVWKAGDDAKEAKPVVSGWVGADFSLPAGKYDVRVEFRASDWAVKEEWVKGLVVEGKREKKVETVKFALDLVKLKVDVAEGEKDANGRAHFALFAAGKTGADDKPMLDVWAGTEIVVLAGTYDLRARLTVEGAAEKVKWEKGVVLKVGEPVAKKIVF